nr:hypothetical protein [Tanacetum cinerariifolium]
FGLWLQRIQFGAGRRDVRIDCPGGTSGRDIVGQRVGGAGQDVRLHRGWEQCVTYAFAQAAQAPVCPRLAHRQTHNRTDHRAEQEATQPTGSNVQRLPLPRSRPIAPQRPAGSVSPGPAFPNAGADHQGYFAGFRRR